MVCKRTRENNNLCILIFVVVMANFILYQNLGSGAIGFPFSLLIKYTMIPFAFGKQFLFSWIPIYCYIFVFTEFTTVSFITWVVPFSFNKHEW
jgi:hypothetical protein